MVRLYLAFIAVIAVERVVELVVSRSNAARAGKHGAIEYGQDHFAWMKAAHASFLVACPLEVVVFDRPFVPLLGYPMLALAVLAQVIRYWAVVSLGRRWNVRVLVIPGMPLVKSGPYRFMRHPNYLAVILEGLAVPLVHSAWITAVGFSALNAWLLSIRIPIEERAFLEHAG